MTQSEDETCTVSSFIYPILMKKVYSNTVISLNWQTDRKETQISRYISLVFVPNFDPFLFRRSLFAMIGEAYLQGAKTILL